MGHFVKKYPPGQAAATDSLLAFDSIDTPCSNNGDFRALVLMD